MKFCFDKKDFIDKEFGKDKLAVIGDDFELSWTSFEEEVNRLCSYFIAQNWVDAKHPIIIYGHKSANMLVAFYAMMKLEIPYIPIDQVYPYERIQKVKEIAQVQIVINTTNDLLALDNTNEVIFGAQGIEQQQSATVDKREDKPQDPLVYIIFTSGSTGEPKGVQISTEAVQSFTRWMTGDFGYTENDVFINTAILSFDLSVFEVMTFGALGASIILNNKTQTADPNELIPRIEAYKGSIWVSTPSFALVYSRIKDEPRMDSIRSFLFCGEVLPHDLSQKLINNYPNAEVVNTYGPTEATVATTRVVITQQILDQYKALPVGVSKPESRLIIEEGEIIIVGPNVSMGYVGNAALNAQKFITYDGQRAFKTGDHGYLENNMLFFNGRNDDLVKLHGYRIELNEISNAINALDYVMHGETIALKRDGIVKKIVALVKLNAGVNPDADRINNDISERLPHYMIPSDIKFVDQIPLNQNGKADKKLLTEIYMQR